MQPIPEIPQAPLSGGHSQAKPPLLHDFAEPSTVHYGKPPQPPSLATLTAEDPAETARRQSAFDSAFAWHGRPLLPFSSSRESLFTQHRLSMGAPSLGSCMEDVDAFLADAHRILWLCSHTSEDWSILRASPAALQCAIDNWADDHVHPRESIQASKLALDIYFAARANQHEPAPVGKAHGDDVGN